MRLLQGEQSKIARRWRRAVAIVSSSPSDELNARAFERNPSQFRGPHFASRNRKSARERSSRDNFPARERRIDRVMSEQFHEMPQSENRTVQDIRRPAMVDQDSISKEVDLEGGELGPPIGRSGCNRMTPPNPKRPMEPVGGDCIGGEKRPIGEDRLHDLKAMSDPINAADEIMFVHAGSWR
jgi:hypothetical protein